MNRTKLSFVLFLLFLFILPASSVHAQSRKRLRELEKVGQEQQGDEESAKNEAMERHLSIQSKQTRKEMKKYAKQSKRVNKNQRQPFFSRVFQKRSGRVRKRQRQ